MRARDAGQDLTNDRACRFPFVLQALQTRNHREYEPEPEPVPRGQSQSQRRLNSHSVGVDRRFLFYIRGDSRTARRRVSHAWRLGVFLFCHGLHKQTMESSAGPRAPRATAVPGGAAVRQARGSDGCASRLPGRRLSRLALVPLEPDRGERRRAQQLPRSRDRKADRARSRLAAAGIPPSKRAAAVLIGAPEWGPLSDGGKTAGGGSDKTARRAHARKSRIARRGRKRRGRAKTQTI